MEMADNKVDIKENYIIDLSQDLLELLLVDHSSKKNIIWATDDYADRGEGYFFEDEIKLKNITGHYGNVIKPRSEKSKLEIQKRLKEKGEVFTPSWVCNSQNNLVDKAWFGYNPKFNMECDRSWRVRAKKIKFSDTEAKGWTDYVEQSMLEVSCGEAPYLVSRYDTVTGDIIEPYMRIGLLDRKIRVVNENANDDKEWLEYMEKAFKSIYGYDWQGDNVLLARENILFTFIDYYIKRFKKMPCETLLMKYAKIVSWNIWQMDGLKFVVPDSCNQKVKSKASVSDNEQKVMGCIGCKKSTPTKHIGIYCKIMNWQTNRPKKFVCILKEKN